MNRSIPLYEVVIESARGKDAIAVRVPQHEIAVLKVVHRPENVKVVGESDEAIDVPVSAYAELGRLARKYRQLGSPDSVRFAFPTGAADLERHGFELTEGEAQAPQASIRRHKPAKPDTEKAAKSAK